MKTNDIIGAVIQYLRESTYLSYIDDNDIFEGARADRPNFPCITVEYVGSKVVEYNYPYEVRTCTLLVNIAVMNYDKDHQLTDDGATTKGLTTAINDVLKALSQDDNLGLTDVAFVQMPNDQASNINYPVRESEITVEIRYRQNRKTRA